MVRNGGFPLRRSRIVRVVVPAVAVAALGSGVAVAAWQNQPMVTADPEAGATVATGQPATPFPTPSAAPDRLTGRTSRDTDRTELPPSPRASARKHSAARKSSTPKPTRKATPTEEPKPVVVGARFTTVDLNVRTAPSVSSKVLTVLDTGSRIKITSTTDNGFRQVVYNQEPVWVAADYLSRTEPKPEPQTAGSGFSTAPCKDGSAVESGLTPDAIEVHRAVCALFPQVTAYYGLRPGDQLHGTGQAIDIMVTEPEGWQIARWARANAKVLGVSQVIHAQHIWTVQRSSEGWRWMPDRGSVTANHYDHVHVSVYGNAGTV